MSGSITVKIAFGIVIHDENESQLPWTTDKWNAEWNCYEGEHGDDFDEWAPDDCPFEIDMWGDLQHWSEECYVLLLKGVEISEYDGVLEFKPSFFMNYDREINDAYGWANTHGIPMKDATWMVVPCVS